MVSNSPVITRCGWSVSSAAPPQLAGAAAANGWWAAAGAATAAASMAPATSATQTRGALLRTRSLPLIGTWCGSLVGAGQDWAGTDRRVWNGLPRPR